MTSYDTDYSDESDDEEFVSVLNKIGGRINKKVFYKWFIDILPDWLLKRYGVKRYGILMEWKKALQNLKCIKVVREGIFGKSFQECACNAKKQYFVSTVNLGSNSKLEKEVSIDKIPLGGLSQFHLFLKEILISIKLNLLSSYTVEMYDKKFPICRNFVKTFHVSSFLQDEDLMYGMIQEKLDYTLHDYIFDFNEEVGKGKKSKDDFFPIYFQIIYGLMCADRFMKFRHNDLHWKNLMILEINDKDFDGFTFIINKDLIYRLPKSCIYLVKFIDFNGSHFKKPEDHNKNTDKKVWELLEDILNSLTSFRYEYGEFERIKKEEREDEKHFRKQDITRIHRLINSVLHFKDRPLFTKMYGDYQYRNDYFLFLLKDLSTFQRKYRVRDTIDWDKLNPKYTFVFSEIDEKRIVEKMYINPNHILC
jgi:hypothetical protein